MGEHKIDMSKMRKGKVTEMPGHDLAMGCK